MTAVIDGRHRRLARDAANHVESTVADIRANRCVVLFDDVAGESVLVLAATAATKQNIAFMVRHTSGVLRATMTGTALDRLNIPPMLPRYEDPAASSDAVTVDARVGVSTGISAADRARTFRVLADPESVPEDLVRPGHVIPQSTAVGGVLQRRGCAEAAVELVALAGHVPVAVIGELLDHNGRTLPLPESQAFARGYETSIVAISDVVTYVDEGSRAS
jgi:3,4-dihydroxy-2-butanone 4-phosphate synthase